MPDYAAQLDGNVKGYEARTASRVSKGFDERNRRPDLARRSSELKKLGCEVREISLPATEYAIACLLHHRDGGGELEPGAL